MQKLKKHHFLEMEDRYVKEMSQAFAHVLTFLLKKGLPVDSKNETELPDVISRHEIKSD
jgi:hypothetical protein